MSINIRASNLIKSVAAIYCILFFLPTVAYSQSAVIDVVNTLIQQLQDEDPAARGRAASQLEEIVVLYPEEIKNSNTVEALIMLTRNDKHIHTRQLAAGILGEIGDARSIETLMTGINEFDLDIVRGAYRFFIRKGEPGTENVLISALFTGSFDEQMAKAFINSGNSQLQKVVREWAESHGYKIFVFPGREGGIKWGSSR